jgi:hypothetical protein
MEIGFGRAMYACAHGEARNFLRFAGVTDGRKRVTRGLGCASDTFGIFVLGNCWNVVRRFGMIDALRRQARRCPVRING